MLQPAPSLNDPLTSNNLRKMMIDIAIKGVIFSSNSSLNHFTIVYPLSYPECSSLSVTLHDNSGFLSSDLHQAV